MKKLQLFLIVTMILVLGVSNGFAQRKRFPRRWKVKKHVVFVKPAPQLGLRYGYATSTEKSYAGVQLWLPMTRFIYFAPSFDYLYGWEGTQYKGNLDLILKGGVKNPLYLGGGLAMHYKKLSGNTGEFNIGGNVFVGLELLQRSAIKPFVQGQWTFINNNKNQFSVLVGLNFRIR